jgi:hypothetical protein
MTGPYGKSSRTKQVVFAVDSLGGGRSASGQQIVGVDHGCKRDGRSDADEDDWLLDQLHTWLAAMLEKLSKKSGTSRAILYALNRWEAIARYCDDGRLEIENLPVERALRREAVARRTTSLPVQTQVANEPRQFTASSAP